MKIRDDRKLIALIFLTALIGYSTAFAQKSAKTASIGKKDEVKISVAIKCNIVHQVIPPYPAIAKAARASGVVRVAVNVNKQGQVTAAEVIEGHPLLREISRATALQWTFDADASREEIKGVINFNFALNDQPNLPAKNKISKLTPAERHYENGQKLAEKMQYDLAILEFRAAIRLDPKYAWAYHELGMAQRDQKQFEEAGKSCLIAHDLRVAELKAEGGGEQDMLYENSLMCLGMTAAIAHRYDEAIGYFRKLSEIEKSMVDVRSMLGTMLYYKGDYEDAEKSLKESLALKPDDVTSLFTLGEVYSAQSRWKEAIDAYKKCIEAEDGPFAPSSHYGLGIAYLRLGDKDMAIKEAQILKKMNNSDKAEQLLQEIKK